MKVNQERIKQMLESGLPMTRIAYTCGVPWKIVKRIKMGEDIPYYKGYTPKKNRPNMCTRCGLRKKAPGNRYLCTLCFSGAHEGEIYPECSVNI